MFPYYLLILFPFYLRVVETMLQPNRGNILLKKRYNSSIILFFVIWFVLLSLRHISCGVDLWNYQYHFLTVERLDFFSALNYTGVEQLYWGFNWIIAQIYPDFRLFIVVMAFLCAGITGWFYWKESEIPILTVLLFVTNACYSMFYSGMRQSVAMLFAIPAYYLVKEKKFLPFILIIFLATYFHKSAAVLFLLYPIFHIPLYSKYFVFVLLFVASFFLLKVQIFNMVVPFLADKWAETVAVETNGYSVWVFFIMLLVFSFIVCDEKKMTPDVLGVRNVLVLMTLIQGFAPIHTLAMRMNYYFIMLFPIIIPKLINRPKDGFENVAQYTKWSLSVFLFLFYLFIACNVTRNGVHIYPYRFLWE